MSSSEWKVSSSSSDISANTNILERSLYSKFRNFLAGNVCCIWNWNRIFRLNGLFTNSVFLATSFPGSPSVETGSKEPWERGCVFGRGGEGGWGISLLEWSAFICHFRNEREIGSSWLSQRLLGLLLGAGGKNWPIADRRVPRTNCGLLFGSSFVLRFWSGELTV